MAIKYPCGSLASFIKASAWGANCLEDTDGVEEDEEDGGGADPAQEEYEQLEEGEF